jgi:hypothetical protein
LDARDVYSGSGIDDVGVSVFDRLREDLKVKASFPAVTGGESMDPLPVTAGDDE